MVSLCMYRCNQQLCELVNFWSWQKKGSNNLGWRVMNHVPADIPFTQCLYYSYIIDMIRRPGNQEKTERLQCCDCYHDLPSLYNNVLVSSISAASMEWRMSHDFTSYTRTFSLMMCNVEKVGMICMRIRQTQELKYLLQGSVDICCSFRLGRIDTIQLFPCPNM